MASEVLDSVDEWYDRLDLCSIFIMQEENSTAENKDSFKVKYGEEPRRDDLTIFVSKRDDPTDHIFVFFIEEPKVGVKSIKNVAEKMRSDGVSRSIIVIQEKITPFARQSLTEMQPKYMIEVVRTSFFNMIQDNRCV
jgi:DNA-directed RNA polymerase I, II, and III subunit RPABC1